MCRTVGRFTTEKYTASVRIAADSAAYAPRTRTERRRVTAYKTTRFGVSEGVRAPERSRSVYGQWE
jgi:hypothetical protein